MKNLSLLKLCSIVLCLPLVLFTACQKSSEFKAISDELGAIHFLDTNWGMTETEALNALTLKLDDAEPYVWEGLAAVRNENTTYLALKEKIELFGLSGVAYLGFSDSLAELLQSDDEAPVYQNFIGLRCVYVHLDETDQTKIESALSSLKNTNRQELKTDDETILSWQSGRLADWKDESKKQAFVDSLGDSLLASRFQDMELYASTITYRQSADGSYYLVLDGEYASMLNNQTRLADSIV